MLWLIFFFYLFLDFFSFVCEKAKALTGPVDVISDERPEELVRRTDDEVPHFLSSSCSFCSYPLSRQSLLSEDEFPSSQSTRKKKASLTDTDGKTLLTAQRTIWAFQQRRSSFMRTLRYAHTLLTYCTCAGGGGDAACWRRYPLFFWRWLEGILRLSSTIAAKLLAFQAPNVLTYITDDCALLSSAFEVFFSRFLTLKNVKNGLSCLVNYYPGQKKRPLRLCIKS